jgi:ribosome-associated translation inhibitor RaiA
MKVKTAQELIRTSTEAFGFILALTCGNDQGYQKAREIMSELQKAIDTAVCEMRDELKKKKRKKG